MSVVRYVPLRIRMSQRRMSVRNFLLLATLASFVFATLLLRSNLQYPFRFHATSVYPFSVREDRWQATDKVQNELLGRADMNITPTMYDVTRPYDNADFECIRTSTRPSATVCLFNVWRDVFISRSLQSAGIWEPYIVDEFVEAVERLDPSAGVR
jgi:hypothetical protein